MKTTIIICILAILFIIVTCAYFTNLSLLKLMKEERDIYKEAYDTKSKTIENLLENCQQAIQLASQCRKEREDLVNALQYADHFIKPRKKLCMWQIATRHLKKNEE